MKEIIEKLLELNKTISTMESCTGGYLANDITNTPRSSEVFKYGAVTYSNEFKIKMGVDKNLIDKYSVYSIEVANNMSKTICEFTNSNYGVGITGKLNRSDKYNEYKNDNEVYISIYDKDMNKYYESKVTVIYDERCKNKELVINKVIENLKEIL